METFMTENSIYVVLIIAVMIWLGFSLYLLMIDKKISNIEKTIENKSTDEL